jgi:hypothetical protein
MNPVVTLISITAVITQCLLLTRWYHRLSAGPLDKLSFWLATLTSSFVLFNTYWASPFQSAFLTAGLATALLVCIKILARHDASSDSATSERNTGLGSSQFSDASTFAGQDASFMSDDTQTLEFPYRSLAEGQIRLLKLSATGSDSGLHFELFHAKLSQRPQYMALSYSWGQDHGESRVSILVNGRTFEISSTLAAALLKMKETNPLPIWVDAICINQYDNIE